MLVLSYLVPLLGQGLVAGLWIQLATDIFAVLFKLNSFTVNS